MTNDRSLPIFLVPPIPLTRHEGSVKYRGVRFCFTRCDCYDNVHEIYTLYIFHACSGSLVAATWRLQYLQEPKPE